jgi:hypothetical protein
MYLYGVRSASNLGRLGRPVLRRRRFRGLAGGSSTGYVPFLNQQQATTAGGDESGVGPIPGTGIFDFLTNAFTGNLTANQTAAIASQESAALVQASGGTMSPAAATAQASSDTLDTIDTFNGPGAFGIDWTGAGPSAPSWASAGLSQIPSWMWWAAGGAGILVLWSMVRK